MPRDTVVVGVGQIMQTGCDHVVGNELFVLWIVSNRLVERLDMMEVLRGLICMRNDPSLSTDTQAHNERSR